MPLTDRTKFSVDKSTINGNPKKLTYPQLATLDFH